MSRSYRKPWIVIRGYPGAKAQANRAVRRAKDIPSGGAYKRCFPQWDIIDWRWYAPDLSSWSDEDRKAWKVNRK